VTAVRGTEELGSSINTTLKTSKKNFAEVLRPLKHALHHNNTGTKNKSKLSSLLLLSDSIDARQDNLVFDQQPAWHFNFLGFVFRKIKHDRHNLTKMPEPHK